MSDPTNPWQAPAEPPAPGPQFPPPPQQYGQFPPPQQYGQFPPAQPPQYGQFPPPQQYGPAPSPYSVAPAGTFKGNHGLSVALLVLGGVQVAYAVLRAATAPSAIHAYDAAAARGVDTRTVVTAHDAVGILGLATLPLWIVGALWLGTVHANARLISPDSNRRSAAWCWLGWWVPVVAWWFPKQIVDDGWQVTAAHSDPAGPGRYRSTALWWGLWVAYSLLAGAGFRFRIFTDNDLSGPYLGHRGVNPVLEFIVAALAIAAFAAWVPVVLGVTRAQTALQSRYAPRPWGQ